MIDLLNKDNVDNQGSTNTITQKAASYSYNYSNNDSNKKSPKVSNISILWNSVWRMCVFTTLVEPIPVGITFYLLSNSHIINDPFYNGIFYNYTSTIFGIGLSIILSLFCGIVNGWIIGCIGFLYHSYPKHIAIYCFIFSMLLSSYIIIVIAQLVIGTPMKLNNQNDNISMVWHVSILIYFFASLVLITGFSSWLACKHVTVVKIRAPVKKRKIRILWIWLGIIFPLFCLIALPCIYLSLYIDNMPGPGMDSTIKTGDLLIANKNYSTLKRGDIVIFFAPPEPGAKFVQRIIGLPGEIVEIKNGTTYINSKPLAEPYITNFDQRNVPPVLVPASSVYVIGDNRPISYDSRMWGPLPLRYIVGTLLFKP